MSGSVPTNRGFVRWTYGDWRRQPTIAKQIERLQRHIEEVERYAFDAMQGSNRLTLQQNMLPRLEEQLKQLQAANTVQTNPAFSRVGGVQKFVRGTGP